tara:strand:- start:101 stop:385 length:285 start_codon:yes stop_codon:yes gene_type:complete
MKSEDINKLPADVKKEFLKLGLKLAEKKKQSATHGDFLSFVKHVWPEFIEGDHHKKIAEKFNRLAKVNVKELLSICHRDILSQSLPLTYYQHGW